VLFVGDQRYLWFRIWDRKVSSSNHLLDRLRYRIATSVDQIRGEIVRGSRYETNFQRRTRPGQIVGHKAACRVEIRYISGAEMRPAYGLVRVHLATSKLLLRGGIDVLLYMCFGFGGYW